MGNVADILEDVGEFVLGDLVEPVEEVVGDGAPGSTGALPAQAPTSMSEALHWVSRSMTSTRCLDQAAAA